MHSSSELFMLIDQLQMLLMSCCKKFGKMDKGALTGFMTNEEKELFAAVPCNEFNTYWIPCTWFVYRLQEASKNGKLISEYSMEVLMKVMILMNNDRHNF